MTLHTRPCAPSPREPLRRTLAGRAPQGSVGCWRSSCGPPGIGERSSASVTPSETSSVGGAGEDFRQRRTAKLPRKTEYRQGPLPRCKLDYIANQLPLLAPHDEYIAAGGGDIYGHVDYPSNRPVASQRST